MGVVAVIPTDLQRGRLGLPSLAGRKLAGRPVLAHAVERAARVEGIDAVVLAHPADQSPMALLEGLRLPKPLHAVATSDGLFDVMHPWRSAARRWSPASWRGGLGGATCYDELLPASAILTALDAHHAGSAVLIGADWPLVDPAMTSKVLALHRSDPEAMKMTFCQAPPGLAGLAISRSLLADMADTPDATVGRMLAYVPSRPQPDPIGRDVCAQIDAAVRSCAHRFIYDTEAGVRVIESVMDEPDAGAIAARLADQPPAIDFPQQVTLELTTRRNVRGPITPQHHLDVNRPDLTLAVAMRIVEQVAEHPGTTLMLGGLGDPLLHEHWSAIVDAAHDAGVMGVGVQTDLLVDEHSIELLLELPLDLLVVNLNADTAATYEAVMGADRFKQVIENLQALLRGRSVRPDRRGLPWIVPSLVKTKQTLADMETFFDRWMHFAGHAVIAPATSGGGLMPEASPVCMAPPIRRACRQLESRMTIHADGQVARCDQDWLGRGAVGNAATQPLDEIWQAMQPVRTAHHRGEVTALTVCNACHEWHRP